MWDVSYPVVQSPEFQRKMESNRLYEKACYDDKHTSEVPLKRGTSNHKIEKRMTSKTRTRLSPIISK
jgi:hypothetical protein